MQINFINLAMSCGAIKTNGPFKLKSGKESSYFFDCAQLFSDRYLSATAEYFADLVNENIDFVFGPAYKAIPLAVAVAARLSFLRKKQIPFAFDRKTEKVYGENTKESKKLVCMDTLRDNKMPNILIVDDVVSSGHTKYLALNAIKKDFPKINVVALIVALDRQEKSDNRDCFVSQEFTEETGIPVRSIITAKDIENYIC